MPSRFQPMTLAEFLVVLDRFTFSRRINAVHMHHTWRPNRKQYAGRASIEAMWRFHTQHNGWSDIAQHLTIAPDGTLWTGRNWNLAPASSSGHNGNSVAGPFMFEMIGDFDKGQDPFDGAQREAALQVVAHVQHHFQLGPDTLRFHNQMSVKTCPGSSISYAATVAAVQKIRERLGTRHATDADTDATPETRVQELLRALREPRAASTSRSILGAEALAEPAEEGMSRQQLQFLTNPPAPRLTEARAPEPVPPAQQQLLRHHVVNLEQGRFSGEGAHATTPADVDALFEHRLEDALLAARQAGRPLHVVFYAHGGLVSEQSGLDSALRYIPWWKDNHVYPIYFVWETGLGGTLGALIRGAGAREAGRGITNLTDQLIERAVGPLGGHLWKNMKDSAEWASDADGGARYVAQKLQEFCARHPAELADGTLALHAVGHSAGSILHAHFLPLALQLGVPAFRSLHLLAPAIRVDAFKQRLAGLLGRGIDHLTLYTMRKPLELADSCALLYRKSLLYLLHYALEAERETPILGLAACLETDADLRRLLAPEADALAEVVWSKTKEPTRRSSSVSTTHGGFDNDALTMESVLHRILGHAPTAPFPKTRDLTDLWHEPVQLPEEVVLLAQLQAEAAPPARKPKPAPPASNGSNRHRALCIGIDDYASAPLSGCVADARAWAAALQARGFATALLLNADATRAGILDRISELVRTSRRGDVLVIQYSGHGTTLTDLDQDEVDDGKDEALCPYNYTSGAYVLDDDLRAIFRRVPPGVNVTLFMDCCHSGTIARLLDDPVPLPAAGLTARFIRATPAMEASHRAFRQELARNGAAPAPAPADGSRAALRVVTFTACEAWEVAYESGGSGEFTSRALQLLAKAPAQISHEQFQRQVRQAFGRRPRQHPTLDCTDAARSLPLLLPLAAAPAKTTRPSRRPVG